MHVGGAGMGARAKLATNLVLGLNRAALAEGLVFAETLGIAPETLPATGAGHAGPLRRRGGQGRAHGEWRLRAAVAHPPAPEGRAADAGAAAQPQGQRLPLTTEVHATLLQAAVAAGDGDLDNAAIVRQRLRRTGRP